MQSHETARGLSVTAELLLTYTYGGSISSNVTSSTHRHILWADGRRLNYWNSISASSDTNCEQWWEIYTVSQKSSTPNSGRQLFEFLADFQNSFTAVKRSKFPAKCA